MNAPKFTTGPWLIARNECHAGQIATVYGVRGGYAEIWSENWTVHGLGEGVQESNLAMIAAAPDLYQSLLEMVEDSDDVDDGKLPKISAATLTRARQALAKAVQP